MSYGTSPGILRMYAEAARSLAANKKRTLAVMTSLACGISALCLIGGYYRYTYWGLGQSLIHSQYGHIQLYQMGYEGTRDIDPFARPIEGLDELMRVLKADPVIDVATARALAFGTACDPETGKSSVIEVRGVDPAAEASIFTFVTSKRGSWLTARDSGKCQISPVLAKELGASLNGDLMVSAVSVDEQQNALPFTVKTLVGSYSREFDALALCVTKDAFSELFGFSGAQEVVILLKDGAKPEREIRNLKRRLMAMGFDLEYRLWYEQAAYYRQVLSYYQGFYRVVLLLAAVLVFFVSATTIGMSLNERLREFGTRLSLGERRSRIVATLALEAVFSGAAGFALGAVIAFALGFGINAAGGIPMPAAPGLTTALKVRILFSPQGAWLSAMTAFLVPPIALIMPARKVLKASIVELLDKGRA